MRILQIVEGKDKGKFILQEQKEENIWETLAVFENKIGAILGYKQLICPFKDGRIVNDITFAVRFSKFLENIRVADAASENELNYLRNVANKLLKYQKYTVQSCSEEERYLKNNRIL